MATKPQTKFTLDDDERIYLRWLARFKFMMAFENENEVARILVRRAIYNMRRKFGAEEPSTEDMRKLVSSRNAPPDPPT